MPDQIRSDPLIGRLPPPSVNRSRSTNPGAPIAQLSFSSESPPARRDLPNPQGGRCTQVSSILLRSPHISSYLLRVSETWRYDRLSFLTSDSCAACLPPSQLPLQLSGLQSSNESQQSRILAISVVEQDAHPRCSGHRCGRVRTLSDLDLCDPPVLCADPDSEVYWERGLAYSCCNGMARVHQDHRAQSGTCPNRTLRSCSQPSALSSSGVRIMDWVRILMRFPKICCRLQ